MHRHLHPVFFVTTIHVLSSSLSAALPTDPSSSSSSLGDDIWVPRVGGALPPDEAAAAAATTLKQSSSDATLPTDTSIADAVSVVGIAVNTDDVNSRYKVTCDYQLWTYYYNWYPLIDWACNWSGDSLATSWDGLWPSGDLLTGEAKNVTLKWQKTGNDCGQTCRQVWSKLYNDASCRGENFWIREKGQVELQGCGMASYHIQHDASAPRLDHGTGLCWQTPTPPSYEPDPGVTRRFCEAAVAHILADGENFTYGREREGFYWSDYNRHVRIPGNDLVAYDQGFVHFWVRGSRFTNVCPPGQSASDEVKKVNVDQCVERITTAESQLCGAPYGVTFGARLWADCFEWGSKASGYWGIQNDVRGFMRFSDS